MTDRDYLGEMTAVLDAETADGEYAAPLLAAHVAEKLQATDPGLLYGWLVVRAVSVLTEEIAHRDRVRRARTIARRPASAFADAAAAYERGDTAPLYRFMNMPFTVDGGVRKPLRRLTAPELRCAADGYGARERQNRMYRVFLSALADTVGAGTVGDRFTEEQVAAMWDSLGGQRTP